MPIPSLFLCFRGNCRLCHWIVTSLSDCQNNAGVVHPSTALLAPSFSFILSKCDNKSSPCYVCMFCTLSTLFHAPFPAVTKKKKRESMCLLCKNARTRENNNKGVCRWCLFWTEASVFWIPALVCWLSAARKRRLL